MNSCTANNEVKQDRRSPSSLLKDDFCEWKSSLKASFFDHISQTILYYLRKFQSPQCDIFVKYLSLSISEGPKQIFEKVIKLQISVQGSSEIKQNLRTVITMNVVFMQSKILFEVSSKIWYKDYVDCSLYCQALSDLKQVCHMNIEIWKIIVTTVSEKIEFLLGT